MENRRLILAIVLSIAVWFVWMELFKKPVPQETELLKIKTQEETPAHVDSERSGRRISDNAADLRVLSSGSAREEIFNIVTDIYRVDLSTRGAERLNWLCARASLMQKGSLIFPFI